MKHAFFDIDGTLYQGYSSNDVVETLLETGVFTPQVGERYQHIREQYRLGKISYNEAGVLFTHFIANALTGHQEAALRSFTKQIVKERGAIFPWVEEVITYLKSKNYSIHLISNSIEAITTVIGEIVHADTAQGSVIEVKDGRYTGQVLSMMNHMAKTDHIQRVIGEASPDHTLGFGDSTGDVHMLSLTDHAFVVRPHQSEMLREVEKHTGRFCETLKNLPRLKR